MLRRGAVCATLHFNFWKSFLEEEIFTKSQAQSKPGVPDDQDTQRAAQRLRCEPSDMRIRRTDMRPCKYVRKYPAEGRKNVRSYRRLCGKTRYEAFHLEVFDPTPLVLSATGRSE